MALSAAAALVKAHYQSTWNQIARGAGLGGKVVTGVMLAIVAVILLLPGAFAVRLGLGMGADLASSADADMLRTWNALQSTFTVGFALLGSFRFKPAFPFSRFGRYPLTPFQLLVAELPASLFEVFPLLGVSATVLMNAGLAIRMPAAAPLVLLLALDGVVALLSIMFIASALWAAISRHRTLMLLLAGVSAAAAFAFGLRGLRLVLKQWLPAFAQEIPIARGYAGLLALRSGETGAGISGIAVATAASALLLVLAARVHRDRLMKEVEGPGWRVGSDAPLRFGTPSSAIGGLFLRQLLRSTAVRAQLVLPLLFTAPVALVTSLSHTAIAEGKVLPENLVAMIGRANAVPWFALVPILAVAMNPQIWMNQFGWDRGGVRTLLLLPLDPRHLLSGKLRGLLGFTAVQTAIGVLPLFTVRMPSVREVVIGLTVGGVALIVTTALGHVLSFRFPRGIDGTAGLQVPLHLGWISPVTLIVIAMGLTGIYAIGDLIAPRGGLFALVLSLAGAILAYRALLPRLATLLRENRERLLAM